MTNKLLGALSRGAWYGAVAISFYYLSLVGTQYVSIKSSPKITSQSHLEEILDDEMKKAGIDSDIDLKIKLSDDEDEVSHLKRFMDGSYEIILSPYGSNVSTLRHELYHLADGHLDNGHFSLTKYFFWYEPQATIYQLTGLKP
jgi:hypothetical protein